MFSTQDIYVTEVSTFADAAPNGHSQTTLYVEDSGMHRTDVLLTPVKAIQTATATLARPFFVDKGGKFEQEYNDDITDAVSVMNVIWQYRFVPPSVNG